MRSNMMVAAAPGNAGDPGTVEGAAAALCQGHLIVGW
jgi:hypothetical protein